MKMRPTKEVVLIAVLLLVGVTSGLDLLWDLSHGAPFSHVFKEALVVALALMLLIWILYEQRQQVRQIKKLKLELVESEQQQGKANSYILSARKQLSEVISKQFDEWNLTQSEREVGWLLLKGFSLKEIAAIRDTLDKTVRQQASAVYKKAQLSGRHAFSAWFIEDLL
ncbi:hypothetical protein MNBD_GAMMA23-709 [hydrothermal vent metagenome]|uniref:HTH luxR-type domain-containing protein n=1 Tax=hydrothermal vent metagenome TaxID=652676 RepID=A0A3B0ZJW5_9ZZZZ